MSAEDPLIPLRRVKGGNIDNDSTGFAARKLVWIPDVQEAQDGTKSNVGAFADRLRGFGPEFKDVDFKFIDDLPPDRAFKDMKVHARRAVQLPPAPPFGPGVLPSHRAISAISGVRLHQPLFGGYLMPGASATSSDRTNPSNVH